MAVRRFIGGGETGGADMGGSGGKGDGTWTLVVAEEDLMTSIRAH